MRYSYRWHESLETANPEQSETERLNQVFDVSSEKNRNILVSFLATLLYILIIVSSTTDLHLLLSSTSFNLPVVNIGIPIVGFYFLAPLLLLVFHFNLLFNLSEHVDLLKSWLELDRKSNLRFPYMINIIPHYQVLDNATAKFKLYIIKGVATFTIIVLPLMVLLFIQIRFLDYHSIPLSFYHTLVVLVDLYVLNKYISHLALPIFKLPNRWLKPIALTLSGTVVLAGMSILIATVQVPERVASYCKEDKFLCSRERHIPYLIPIINVYEKEVSKIKEELKYTFSSTLKADTAEFWTLYQKADLQKRHLELANLEKASLYNVDLRDAILIGAHMEKVELQGADLRAADFKVANLEAASLHHALLDYSSLKSADLEKAKLPNASLKGSRLTGANLESAEFIYSNLEGVQMQGANLENTTLFGANMSDGNLLGANLHLAWLIGADLSDALMVGANLTGAKLQAADLSYSHLEGATIENAKFTAAHLSQASLQGATIKEVNFDHCVVDRTAIYALKFTEDFREAISSCLVGNFHSSPFETLQTVNNVDYSKPLVWNNYLSRVKQELLPGQIKSDALIRLENARDRALTYMQNDTWQDELNDLGKQVIADDDWESNDAFWTYRRKLACQDNWIGFGLLAMNKVGGVFGSNPHRGGGGFGRKPLYYDSELQEHMVTNPQCDSNDIITFLLGKERFGKELLSPSNR